ncbi:hypothetical protein BC567DRAFT_99967 [Phyllosticta citribraziliensis]
MSAPVGERHSLGLRGSPASQPYVPYQDPCRRMRKEASCDFYKPLAFVYIENRRVVGARVQGRMRGENQYPNIPGLKRSGAAHGERVNGRTGGRRAACSKAWWMILNGSIEDACGPFLDNISFLSSCTYPQGTSISDHTLICHWFCHVAEYTGTGLEPMSGVPEPSRRVPTFGLFDSHKVQMFDARRVCPSP